METRRPASLEKFNLAYAGPQLESPESSSPIVTRAVAAGLRGETCDAYHFSRFQRAALKLLGSLPQAAARFAISRFETVSGLDPGKLEGLSIDELADERLQDYVGLNQRYPAVVIGAALGGASAHLSLAVGGPFLPQAFVTTLKGGSPDGDVRQYFQQSAALAKRFAENNPAVLTIQHYDPVHDEWMTRYVNHLRFKLLDLPEPYKAFIRERLAPGGAVIFLDSRAKWLRYRLGERSLFQVGGWGDISAEEFLNGSERLRAYCERVGLKNQDWRLKGFPLERGPESEWGVEPGLGEALECFCEEEGYEFVPVRFSEPHDYSRLAFYTVQKQLEKAGREPAGVLIEMFSQYDATAVLRSGLLPLWLIFNTWDSLRFLEEMRPNFPVGKPVFFSPLSTFTLTPDLVPWTAWEAALEGMDWINIGARASHYPADAHALTGWAGPLRAWVAKNQEAALEPISWQELASLADSLAGS